MAKLGTGAIVVVLALVVGVGVCWAGARVAVMPFQIFSAEPLGYLSGELQRLLAKELKAKGVEVVDPQEVSRALAASGKPLELSLARRIAGQLGADYAVYGSVTKLGRRVSVDIKMLDVAGLARPKTVYAEGLGLEALEGLCRRLAREVAVYAAGRERVAEVRVRGNKAIEAAAIKAVLKTVPGGVYSRLLIDEDIRAIWKMGFFEDVRAEVSSSARGKVVTFVVKEKPRLREVRVIGNKLFDTKDLLDQAGLKPSGPFNPAMLKEAEARILKMYHDKGYYDAKVRTSVYTLGSGEKGVKIEITEGKKLYIKAIRFEGNHAFSDSELKDLMATSEEGWLSWLTGSGVLEREKLEQDIQKIQDFYYNHGYLLARVGGPVVRKSGQGLVVTIKIVEGPRFKVGKVDVAGELILPRDKLLKRLSTRPGQWYSRQRLRRDVIMLHDLYADKGYAYVDIRPRMREDRAKAKVDIRLEISRGPKVYFENIIITGNTRTKDKVIRRELGVAEGDLFSASALRKAAMRLRRLNYFEDIQINTTKGSRRGLMNLSIKVKEKRTGQISLGAGYSTVDKFMVMGAISESNLFGTGRRLSLRGQLGGKSTRYTLSFTEPWFMDRPISAGFDLFDWKREYINYDKESVGGRLRFGFPTPWEYTRWYLYYTWEEATITGVAEDAALIIRDQEGTHTTSSIRTILRRDSRDHIFNPTRGSDNSISVEYAGGVLGGTNAFIKVIGDSGWYFPIIKDHVLVLHGRIGWLTGHSGGELPIYEKFFLGGINTLRGFEYHSVSPKDPATGDVIGGERMVVFNIEYRVPLLRKAGIVGVIFYDTGNCWSAEDGYKLGDLRKSVGAGIRWLSPIGPLRLEYGYVLDPEPGEDQANWEFTIGSMF